MDINKIIFAFSNRTIQDAIDSFIIEQNDDITNSVRAYLDKLPKKELLLILEYLSKLLNLCYNCKLYNMEIIPEEQQLIDSLNEKERFLLKQFALYYSGRLSIGINLELLKKIYQIDDDKFIRLNVIYSTLLTFDEEVEMDFIDRLLTDTEYDFMIRSWSLAFFKGASNPYEYQDKSSDDWSLAKVPRIKRLSIDDETNPKFKKAMAYRLIDLVVIYLFVRDRGIETLTDSDKEIIKNCKGDYELFSDNKKAMIVDIKQKII